MIVLAATIFIVVGLAAAAFVAWPALQVAQGRKRFVIAASISLFVVTAGLGTYGLLGRPQFAVRTLEGDDVRDRNGAIALLVKHLRGSPDDLRGWHLLGRAYMDADDGGDAVRALQRAIALTSAQGRPDAGVYSDYGTALVLESGGRMPAESEQAFRMALAVDPRDRVALFFLGQLAASRGQYADAETDWQRLLSELPVKSPFRQQLLASIARLHAMSGARPDIGAMVSGLATRLKQEPDDLQGWQRLVRAYAVLGDRARALQALRDARSAMVKRPDALAALSMEAKELKLEN